MDADRGRGDWLAVGLLVLLQLVLWKLRIHDAASIAHLELGGIDHYIEHHPMMLLAARRLLAGELPLWNPHELCGMPLLAVPHVGVFYPPNWLFLVLEPVVAEEAALLLHLAFAAVCTYGLARAWGAPVVAALAAGLVFAWCGRMNTLVNQHAPLIVLSWLPATVWLVERAVRRERYALPLLAVAVAAQILAGYHDGALLNLQAAGLYTILRLAPRARGAALARTLGLALALLGAVLLGVALAAPQLAPTLELVSRSDRFVHPLTLEQAVRVGVIPPADLLTMLVSNRSVLPEHLRWAHVHAGFLSLLALALGAGVRSMRPLYLYAVVISALAVLLTAGGFFFELYFATPLGENFRRPWKALALLGLGLALLTAIAVARLEGWIDAPAARVRRRPAFLAALLVGALLALWAGIGWASASVLAGLGLLAFLPGAGPRRAVVVGLVALNSAQLFLAFENRHVRLIRQPDALRREETFWRELGARAETGRLLTSGWLNRDPALAAKQAVIQELSFTNGHESLATRRHALVFAAGGAAPYMSLRFYGPSTLPVTLRPEVFDRAATRLYVLTAQEELTKALSAPGAARALGFRRLDLAAPAGVVVFERRGALPRARFVSDVRPVADRSAARRALAAAEAGPVRPVLEPAAGAPARTRAAARGTVRIRSQAPERVELDVEASGPGYVVLADSVYPGWRASVDGRDVPIHPADLLFRAVAVPGGTSRVVFEYRPRSLGLGLAIGGAAWLLLIALFVRELAGTPAGRKRPGSPLSRPRAAARDR